jgi:hypothetical protein
MAKPEAQDDNKTTKLNVKMNNGKRDTQKYNEKNNECRFKAYR